MELSSQRVIGLRVIGQCGFVISAKVLLTAQVFMIASKLAKSWLTMHDFVNAFKLVTVKIICNIIKEPLAFLDLRREGLAARRPPFNFVLVWRFTLEHHARNVLAGGQLDSANLLFRGSVRSPLNRWRTSRCRGGEDAGRAHGTGVHDHEGAPRSPGLQGAQ